MAIYERDVVLQGKSKDGNRTIDLPITRLGNIEDSSDIKEKPAANDYIPIIDMADNGQMKKALLTAIVSGRNLLRHSGQEHKNGTPVYQDIFGTEYGPWYLSDYGVEVIKRNRTVTLSFDAKKNGDYYYSGIYIRGRGKEFKDNFAVWPDVEDSLLPAPTIDNLSTEYTRYKVTFTIKDEAEPTCIYFGSSAEGDYSPISVKNMKLEIGEVATDWTPAPEDVTWDYEKLQNKPTIPPAVAVKGNAEATYRTGNVNLTPANLGAFASANIESGLVSVSCTPNTVCSANVTFSKTFSGAPRVTTQVFGSSAAWVKAGVGVTAVSETGFTVNVEISGSGTVQLYWIAARAA